MTPIREMYSRYGFNAHKQCKDCPRFRTEKRETICTVYGSSERHWKPGHPACGLAKPKEEKIDEDNLRGQMSLEDWLSEMGGMKEC